MPQYNVNDLDKYASTRKLPDGFSIRVVRKEDILATIDKNILDKEVALEIISHCEISAANYFKNGYWASIPYMGNFRLDPRKLLRKQAMEDLDPAARQMLDSDDIQSKARYVLFKKQIAIDAKDKVAFDRLYEYIVALWSNKYPKLFRRYIRKHGGAFARLHMWGLANITVIDNRFEYVYADELAANRETLENPIKND